MFDRLLSFNFSCCNKIFQQFKQMLHRAVLYLRPRTFYACVRYTFTNNKDSNIPTTQEEKKNMQSPFVAGNSPMRVELQVGQKYSWCTCGLSNNQPFCDGSHKGTIFKSTKFVAQNVQNYMCMCKQTKGEPFCDGSHNNLKDNKV